jgi:hypothetical protein
MQLHEMRQQVLAEMEHIPRHPKQHQSDLRMTYWLVRMNSLGKRAEGKKTAADVLHESIALIRKQYPDFEPRYDEKFFAKKRGK